VAVRAIRGATQVEADQRDLVLAATRELVQAVLDVNALRAEDMISILFTATADLSSQAPALGARQVGLDGVALLCAQEMQVEGSMPRVIRLMAHVDVDPARGALRNIYLRGTEALRSDPAEGAPSVGEVPA